MIHPDTEIRFIDEEKGYGVVAIKPIPEGAITWVQDDLDQVFTQDQVTQMHPRSQEMIDKFAFRNRYGNYVLCWDRAKYVNHSFTSNCFSTPYGFEIAVKNISPGEELTDDYGYLNLTEPFEARNEGTSRSVVYPDDLLSFHSDWDHILQNSFGKLKEVRQPLFSLLSTEILKDLEMVLQGEKPLDSILKLYCG